MDKKIGTVKTWEHDGLRAEMVVTEVNWGYAAKCSPKAAITNAHGRGPLNEVIRSRFGIRPA